MGCGVALRNDHRGLSHFSATFLSTSAQILSLSFLICEWGTLGKASGRKGRVDECVGIRLLAQCALWSPTLGHLLACHQEWAARRCGGRCGRGRPGEHRQPSGLSHHEPGVPGPAPAWVWSRVVGLGRLEGLAWRGQGTPASGLGVSGRLYVSCVPHLPFPRDLVSCLPAPHQPTALIQCPHFENDFWGLPEWPGTLGVARGGRCVWLFSGCWHGCRLGRWPWEPRGPHALSLLSGD